MELVTTMGAVGLLLAIAGFYRLVAYNVNRRTGEIGIRTAICTGALDVFRLVMRQGMVPVTLGTMAGLAMGFAVEPFLNAMLFDSGGVDSVACAVIVPSMFLVTVLAAYIPARKACRIAPTQVLRYE